MTFDTMAPQNLVKLQKWFGGVISQNMADDHSILPYAPSGKLLSDEAKQYIAETDTLDAKDRMQIYNQSYWLRLLAALQEEYPFVTCLFGKDGFDQAIGIPYLLAYPPSHWSLNLLGINLVEWLTSTYTAGDKKLVLAGATIDWACQQSFFAKQMSFDLSKYQGASAENLLTEPVKLQPHIFMMQTYGHFMNHRQAFLAQAPEYWEEHDFPQLEKERCYHFVISRNPLFNIEWDEIMPEEYQMLRLIEQAHTIEQACDRLQELPNIDLKLIEDEVAFWVQKWLLKGWLWI